jgi:hypothetical protein
VIFGLLFWLVKAGQGFSIRILLFGKMELDLPTPGFHLLSRECAVMQCTHPQNTFASIKNELDKKKKIVHLEMIKN